MEREKILRHIDHTALQAVTTWKQIEILCGEAIRDHMASVCVPPCYVERIRREFGDRLNICTVIGFPLGYNTTDCKAAEARQAVADGASEVDMVINIGDVKNGDFDKVEQEIKQVKGAVGDRILKVIVETCYLTDEEKVRLCGIVTRAKADYIKTSTGFGTSGAKLEDIRIFKKNIGPDVKIKAAGGIRSREDLEAFLEEGCDRIGTSSAVKILNGQENPGY